MINDDMPVVIGAKRYFDKNLTKRIDEAQNRENISQFYKTVDEKDIERKKRQKKGWYRFNKKQNPPEIELTDVNQQTETENDQPAEPIGEQTSIPFILFEMQMTKKSYEDKIGSIIRIERIKFGIQEFFI